MKKKRRHYVIGSIPVNFGKLRERYAYFGKIGRFSNSIDTNKNNNIRSSLLLGSMDIS